MRRNVHVKPKWKRHKNPQTLEGLQSVRLQLMEDMQTVHAGKRPLGPGGDKDMVCGWDVCDELDELDENSFSDTYVNDRDGEYTDDVTGVTLLRDDVAQARMEDMRWYEKFQALDEVSDETCVLRT